MTRRAVALAALLSLALLSGVCTAAPGPGDATAAPESSGALANGGTTTSETSDADTLRAETTLHGLPERPGEVRVEVRYATPDRLGSLEVRAFDDPTVEATDGFDAGQDDTFVWNGRTDDPSISYVLAVNRTFEGAGPIAGPGAYTFVDTGEWALIRQPRLSHSWSWSGGGQVELVRETTVAGPGAVGERMAFLGDHETVTREAHGQRFTLVVPEAATMAERPEDVFDSMSHASDALRVGDRDDEVFVVAAPTGDVSWGVRGLQTGDADMWVRDVERLDSADNVWLHEYVHARQGYATGEETRWFTEAAATYYAALLALEQERIDYEQFRTRLSAGRHSRHADVVLADPATWQVGSNYNKGALAAGELDRRLRLATDSGATLQEPFRRMNEHGGEVDQTAFLGMVANSGGEEPLATAERYTGTTATPELWSAEQHEAAFGQLPARISYALPGDGDTGGIRVDGEYRQRALGDARPVTLATGERLSVDATVQNSGGTAGAYDAAFRVDGAVVDRRTGELAPGESRTVTFERTFDGPGEYALSVGGDRLLVSVREPAAARVTDVAVSPDRIAPDESVTVAVTVGNGADYPARGTVTVRVGGAATAERTVTLDAGEERTVELPVTFERAGTYRVSVDGRDGDERTVRVSERSDVGGWAEGGLAPAALALAVLVALAAAGADALRRP